MAQSARGEYSAPDIVSPGTVWDMIFAMVPSPHPTSSSVEAAGSMAARCSASTTIRRRWTSCPCALPTSWILRLPLIAPLIVANIGTATDAKHAEEEGGKNHLHAEKHPHGPEKNCAQSFIERAEAAGCPLPCYPDASGEAGKEENAAESQPMLELNASQHTFQGNRVPVETLGITEDFGKEPHRYDLRTHQSENNPKNHGVNIDLDTIGQMLRTGQQPKYKRQPHYHKKGPGKEKEPVGRVEEHETQAAPAIAEGAQVGRTPALVGPQCNRDLGNVGSNLARQIGANIAEVPITLWPDKRGRPPHLRTFRDGWRSLRFMLLYAPNWLFLFPGAFLMIMGLALVFWLLPGPQHLTDRIEIDIHTMVFGVIFTLMGAQVIAVGFFAKVFSYAERFDRNPISLKRMLRRIQLEHGLAFGGVLFLAGFAGCVWIAWKWAASGFGPLYEGLRAVLFWSMWMFLGVQVIFSSFFLSMLGISRGTYIGDYERRDER